MAQIQEQTSSGDEMYLFNTTLTNTTGIDRAWYLDTGAAHHMTHDKRMLTEFKLLPSPLEVHLGDDSIKQAKGFGTLTFSLPNNQHLQIQKVYFVRGLTKNLLSISQATQCGFTVIFKGNSCILQPQLRDGTSPTISCLQINNLYPIPLLVIKMSNAIHQMSDNVTLNTLIWHYGLGHPHFQALQTLHKQNLVDGISGPLNHLPFCEGCLFGKMTPNPYPRSTKHTTNVLQLIHTDLCGPMPTPSLTRKLYFLTFLDDFSHFTITTFLFKKSEVLSHFITYKNFVENQLNREIKLLRSDNGSEYTSNKFDAFLQSHGILHQTSIPYHPQQNGNAERKNRRLMDIACSLLKTSNLPNSFWEEVVVTACYLQNRLPTTTLSLQTPFEKWSGIKPNLSHLKIFGSIAYSYVPSERRDKLEDRAIKQIFFSYDDHLGKKG
mgnify:CR=1 FL=1